MSTALASDLERQTKTTRHSTALWVAAAAVLLVYLVSCFSPAILDDADATHAQAAREMAATGDFVTLHVNGIRYLEKAPLMYWAVALCYKAFGVNEFATRLPLFAAALLCALLACAWGRRAFGDKAGFYAGLFLPSAIGFYLFTRILIPEVILTLFLGAAMFALVMALSSNRGAWWYGVYAATALGVLTKGLVAIAFVAGPAAIYLLVSGEWRRWREFRVLTGTVVFLAVAAPWHILAGVRNEGFFWFYFVNEHILRFLGRRYPKDYNKLPAAAYWTMHLVWLFPFTLYLPAVVRDLPNVVRLPRTRPLTFQSRSTLMLWIWSAFILAFFAFSTNQEYYTFPVYFPLCLLLAKAAAETEDSASRLPMMANSILLGIGAACAAVLGAGLWSSRHLPFVADIGTVLEQRGVGDYTLSMSHFFDLTGSAFAALRLPAALAIAAFVIGPLAALLLRFKRRHQAATAMVVLTFATFLMAAHIALGRFEPYLSSKAFARAMAPELRDSDKVFIYGDQAFGSSLLLYLDHPVNLVNGRSTSMEFGSRFPDAPRIFYDDREFMRTWESGTRTYVFAPRERREDVARLIGNSGKLVAEISGKALYVNQR